MTATMDFMAPATTGVMPDNFTFIYFGFALTGSDETTEKRAKIEEKMTEKRVRR